MEFLSRVKNLDFFDISTITYLQTLSSGAEYAIFVVVNGGYTWWTSWSRCSNTCDEGIKTRTRACTSPLPRYGGLSCSGEDKQSERCNERACRGQPVKHYIPQFACKPILLLHFHYRGNTEKFNLLNHTV